MKRTGSITLAATVALVFACAAQATTFQDLLERYRDGVAYIVVHQGGGKQSVGTGFVIDDNRTIITNAHVLDGAQAVFARFPDGSTIRCRLVALDRDHDLAAIRLEQGTTPAKLALAPRQSSPPQTLDDVLLISNPQGLSFTAVTGQVSARRSSAEVLDAQGQQVFRSNFPVYQVNIAAAHGSSGGPVIDKAGQVVGVLTAGLDHGRAGLNFAVPHHHVHALDLSRNPTAFADEQNGPSLSSNFTGTGLSYSNNQRPTVSLGAGKARFDVSSNHWGFIDPNFIGQYIDDSPKAAQLVPLDHFYELAHRNKILHITNAPFRLSTLVPEHYQLAESYNAGTETYEARYSSIQHGNASVRIRATRIPPPAQHQLNAALDHYASRFMANELGRFRVPYFSYPLRRNEVVTGNLSDLQPRVGAVPGTIKFWRQYLGAQVAGPDGIQPTQGTMVLYGINGDLFVTVDFTYFLPPPGPLVAPDVVERMFIASTVSFIN